MASAAQRIARIAGQVNSIASPGTACPSLQLRGTGARMPVVGLGTWKIEKSETAKLVEAAIRAGYRHIDCACDYGNEIEVGQGIQAALRDGVCSRADLWVTSKLWNTYHRKEHVQAACKRTLTDLGLEYVDLYLIHFPISLKFVPFEVRYPPEWIYEPAAKNAAMELDTEVDVGETWCAMEGLVEAGLVRNIGVANFNVQLLQHLRSVARIQPQVNQVELHPFLTQKQLVKYCETFGIILTGFSPLGAGSYVSLDMAKQEESVLSRPEVLHIAKRHSKSPAQVVLRWATLRGYSVVPKSSQVKRLEENISIFDFALSEEEMALITALDCGRRYNDPGVFCVGMGACCPIFG